jgi:hypothetical protein
LLLSRGFRPWLLSFAPPGLGMAQLPFGARVCLGGTRTPAALRLNGLPPLMGRIRRDYPVRVRAALRLNVILPLHPGVREAGPGLRRGRPVGGLRAAVRRPPRRLSLRYGGGTFPPCLQFPRPLGG